MSEPTKTQIACNAIRDMFFHKHYNGIVPAKDLEVVKNGKQWHAKFGKKAVQDAVKELISDGYITLDGAKENWIWGFAGMNQELFNNSLIHDIGKRKERGIDPTANELEEIKTFAKSHIEFIEHFGEDNSGEDQLSLMKKIYELFPSEVCSFIDDSM
jgi:hypothetical protein